MEHATQQTQTSTAFAHQLPSEPFLATQPVFFAEDAQCCRRKLPAGVMTLKDMLSTVSQQPELIRADRVLRGVGYELGRG
ncbi:hypothetical protein DN069_07655 [Streptacidiphilus pinicola]|uniref:Uncharacterized protein n=1 Tax=Streptacidiphilus pinicola TaxID=2219663 RepID=A0A2X0IRL1_9ACTN|nr:hypothetical protein DN069_07655 [Streptacidiphilus pinicola]